jgi:hypothetical protein
MRYPRFVAVTVILAALSAAPALADIYIEQYTKHSGSSGSSSEPEGLTKMWISEWGIRIVESDGKIIHITDLAGNRLVTIDTEKKEYFEIQLDQVRADLERASARMKQQLRISWDVVDLNQTQVISGFNCRALRFVGSGGYGGSHDQMEITIDFWLSSDTDASMDVFLRLMDAIGMGQNPFVDSRIISELRRAGGFPIKTVTNIKMGTINDRIEQTVQKIEHVAASPSLFQIPAGYDEAKAPPRR